MLSKNKKTEKTKKIIISLIIVFSFLLIICIINLYKKINKEIYQVDSRISNIKIEKKKDNGSYKTIGWLKVQGTNIDTPILAITNNENVDKENYLWNLTTKEKKLNKVNILGHNLLNLSSHPDVGLEYFSRFDDLMAFVYYDFVKNNKYIEYTIDGKDYIYKVFSVSFVNHDSQTLYADKNYTEKEMKKYIDKSRKNSFYDFKIDVNEKDDVISLVTCTRFFGDNDKMDFKVDGRLLRKNERKTNYTVKENKKYDKIKKILKGDEENEKA